MTRRAAPAPTPGARLGGSGRPAVLAALTAAAAAAAVGACERLEFYELTEPVPGATPSAGISFNSQESDGLVAHLAVQLRDWSPAGALPEVLLDGSAIPPDPRSDERRVLFQHGWAPDPQDRTAFPLPLQISAPGEPFGGCCAIELALPIVVRQGDHSVCPGDELVLDYQVLGELPEHRQWSLVLAAPGNSSLRLTGQGLPDPPMVLPLGLIPLEEGATAAFSIHTWGYASSDPEIALSVTSATTWSIQPGNDNGSCSG